MLQLRVYVGRAAGALAVLGINVAGLLVGATGTLLVQRRLAARQVASSPG